MANKKLSDEKSQVSLRGQELEVIKLKEFLSFWQNRYTVREGDTLICQVAQQGRSFRLYATFGRKRSQYYGPQTRWENHCFI